MNISEDTLAVINYLHEAIEGGLRKRNDVAVVLELAAASDDAETFNHVTRLGTGAWKVYSTLRRVKPGDEGYRLLEEVTTALSDISPFSVSVSKFFQIGYVMKNYYSLFSQTDLNELLEHSFGFNAYMEHLTACRSFVINGVIHKCSFIQSLDDDLKEGQEQPTEKLS